MDKSIVRLLVLAGLTPYLVSDIRSPWAETRTFTIGKGDLSWYELGEQVAGLEVLEQGAIQPKELESGRNILVGPRTERDELTNSFDYIWSLKKVGRGEDFKLGENSRFWTGTFSSIYHGGPRPLIDGDPDSANQLRSIRKGAGGEQALFTFDFGFPVPINRVVFYAPDNGLDETGNLRKQRFPRAYEVSAALEPVDYLLVTEESKYHTLDKLINRTYFNDNRVVDLHFPTQILRFLRLSFNLVDQTYLLGEIEVYGEGFVASTSYRTIVLNLNEPVNFGRIFWDFETFKKRANATDPILAPEAPIELVLETRTGYDDSPKTYHIFNDIGFEQEVDLDTYRRAPEPSIRLGIRPGDKGSIADDLDNWSLWSTPYKQSGDEIRSPDGRPYLQLQFRLNSEDFRSFGRLNSLTIEYSPLLVERIVGEIGIANVPDGQGDPVAPVGVNTVFTYDILAELGSEIGRGFDVIRINTLSDVEFVKMEMGESRREVVPDSVETDNGQLVIYFPSNEVSQSSASERIRISFRTTLLNFSTNFTGEIAKLGSGNLPQSINPGNANKDLTSDDTRVFAAATHLKVLEDLSLSTAILTPNEDGINDALNIELILLGVERSQTKIAIYDLAGRLVRSLATDDRGRGLYKDTWDGLDEKMVLVPPGTYLLQVQIETDKEISEVVRSLAVAY